MSEKTKIVVIDDEPEVCDLVKQILDRTGRYEVSISTHAQEGIDMVKRDKPALVMLDQMMPEMNGLQVAQAIVDNADTGNTVIVFLSGVAAHLAFMASMVESEGLADKPAQRKGHYFIQKPISPQELVKRLDAILSGAE